MNHNKENNPYFLVGGGGGMKLESGSGPYEIKEGNADCYSNLISDKHMASPRMLNDYLN